MKEDNGKVMVEYSFSELFDLVRDHMQWTDEKTLMWWLTKNPIFDSYSPVNLYLLNKIKIEKIILELISDNYREEESTDGAQPQNG